MNCFQDLRWLMARVPDGELVLFYVIIFIYILFVSLLSEKYLFDLKSKIVLETVGPEYRAIVGMAIEFGWAFGYIVLPGAAYLLRDFRWIQLAVTLPEFVLLLWWFSLPESPRWQLTHGKLKEAEVAIRRAAEINGKSTQSIETKLAKLMDKAIAVRLELI